VKDNLDEVGGGMDTVNYRLKVVSKEVREEEDGE